MTEIEETDEGFETRTMERAFKRAVEAEARAYAAEADSAKLRAALEAIVLLDRSKPYEYGERRPSDGTPPPEGRWITPREKAALTLGSGPPPPGERERVLTALKEIRAEAAEWRETHGEDDDVPDYASGLLSAVLDIEEAMR